MLVGKVSVEYEAHCLWGKNVHLLTQDLIHYNLATNQLNGNKQFRSLSEAARMMSDKGFYNFLNFKEVQYSS